jgi:hypothetical protein
MCFLPCLGEFVYAEGSAAGTSTVMAAENTGHGSEKKKSNKNAKIKKIMKGLAIGTGVVAGTALLSYGIYKLVEFGACVLALGSLLLVWPWMPFMGIAYLF